RVSLSMLRDGLRNLWLLQLNTNVLSPLTFETDPVFDPIWSPDGKRLAYQIYQPQETKVVTLTLGERSPKGILEDGNFNFPDDWSPAGKWILARRIVNSREAIQPASTSISVILIASDGSAPPKVLWETKHLIDQLQFSPDGQWVAYNSIESGQWEVY